MIFERLNTSPKVIFVSSSNLHMTFLEGHRIPRLYKLLARGIRVSSGKTEYRNLAEEVREKYSIRDSISWLI